MNYLKSSLISYLNVFLELQFFANFNIKKKTTLWVRGYGLIGF
jgi:hypothetical protein